MQEGETALHKACGNGNMEVTRALIQFGASIDQKDKVSLSYVCDIVSYRLDGVLGLERWFTAGSW